MSFYLSQIMGCQLIAPEAMLPVSMRRTALAVSMMSVFLSLPGLGDLYARMPRQPVGEQSRHYYQFLFLYESTHIYEDQRSDLTAQKEVFVHPFYSRYEHTDRAYKIQSVLYPVFYNHGTNYWNRWSILYFWTGEDLYHEDDGSDSDFFLAPFFSWGSGGTENDRYFSFFPVYGTFNDKFGWDKLEFVLFPVYSTWQRGRYKAHSLLWPLIMWGGDGLNRNDFRFLPFYSKKEHRGKYIQKSIVWPFFQWGSTGLDRKDPRHHFLFLPFYAQKHSDSGQMYAYSILYPFSLVAWGADEAVGAKELRVLWFIYQDMKSESPYTRKKVLFPFYAHYQFGNPELDYYKEMNFYFILLGRLTTRSAIIDSEYDFFVPFYYNLQRTYRKENRTAYSLKVWPLFHSYSDTGESNGWQTVSLWPFPDDYIDRNWGPYYSLAEYKRHQNGDRYFGMLFRVYSQYWNEKDTRWFLAGFDYRNSPDHFHFSLLGGLLGYKKSKNYAQENFNHYLQLFWLDI